MHLPFGLIRSPFDKITFISLSSKINICNCLSSKILLITLLIDNLKLIFGCLDYLSRVLLTQKMNVVDIASHISSSEKSYDYLKEKGKYFMTLGVIKSVDYLFGCFEKNCFLI